MYLYSSFFRSAKSAKTNDTIMYASFYQEIVDKGSNYVNVQIENISIF